MYENAGLIFTVLILAAPGVVAFFEGVKAMGVEKYTNRFLPGVGVISKCEVQLCSNSVYKSDDETHWYPEIVFNYVIEGVRFENGRFRITKETPEMDRNRAKEVCDRFKIGQKVEFWYDPEDLSLAVIDISNYNYGIRSAIGGLLLLILAGLLWANPGWIGLK
jgi:hypothetical protein